MSVRKTRNSKAREKINFVTETLHRRDSMSAELWLQTLLTRYNQRDRFGIAELFQTESSPSFQHFQNSLLVRYLSQHSISVLPRCINIFSYRMNLVRHHTQTSQGSTSPIIDLCLI